MRTRSVIYLIFFLCIACEKEDVKSTITYESSGIGSCMTDYFYDTGSMWIYRNVNTLDTHSINVSGWEKLIQTQKSKIGPGPSGSFVHIEHEIIKTEYSSSLGENYNEYLMADFINSNGHYWYSEIFFCTPGVDSSDIILSPYNSNHSISFLDSIQVNETNYYNVIKSRYTGEFIYHIKPGIGIIRKQIFTGPEQGTYELIDYDVSFFELPE